MGPFEHQLLGNHSLDRNQRCQLLRGPSEVSLRRAVAASSRTNRIPEIRTFVSSAATITMCGCDRSGCVTPWPPPRPRSCWNNAAPSYDAWTWRFRPTPRGFSGIWSRSGGPHREAKGLPNAIGAVSREISTLIARFAVALRDRFSITHRRHVRVEIDAAPK